MIPRYLILENVAVNFVAGITNLVGNPPKIKWVCNTKVDISVILFIHVRLFSFLISNISSWFFHKYLFWHEIRRCEARLREGVFVVRVDFVYPLRMKGGFLVRRAWKGGSWLLKGLRIGYRLCGYSSSWGTSIATPFPLKVLNCRYSFDGQLIFISRNGNLSFVTTWTLSSCAGMGWFSYFLQIMINKKIITKKL